MKTIEEQAVDYIKNVFPQRHILYKLEWVDIAMFMKRAFLAGAQAATRWIPVEEELPEEELAVLIMGKDIVPCQEDYVTEAFLLDGVWQDPATGSDMDGKVTHWLPIPPAPEK
ncbi:MAG: DUF551 domain-containing protein [Rikenella sp.]|nr:DUF551 domain-containing protein [Rikenella sp.]